MWATRGRISYVKGFPGLLEFGLSSSRVILSRVFDEVIEVNLIDSADYVHLAFLKRPDLGITLTKLHCWTLTHYSKCVFLDADTLVSMEEGEAQTLCLMRSHPLKDQTPLSISRLLAHAGGSPPGNVHLYTQHHLVSQHRVEDTQWCCWEHLVTWRPVPSLGRVISLCLLHKIKYWKNTLLWLYRELYSPRGPGNLAS